MKLYILNENYVCYLFSAEGIYDMICKYSLKVLFVCMYVYLKIDKSLYFRSGLCTNMIVKLTKHSSDSELGKETWTGQGQPIEGSLRK